jgi:AmiR/NasT family two-component response regulator
VLEAQAGAPFGAVAEELEVSADFHFAVHNAAGIVSVQEDVSVTEALIRLRAHAFSNDRPINDVAQGIIARTLRLS